MHNVEDWDCTALRHHFGFAGFVSRLGSFDGDRIAFKIIKYRDRDWLNLIESQNNGRQIHGRYLRIWR